MRPRSRAVFCTASAGIATDSSQFIVLRRGCKPIIAVGPFLVLASRCIPRASCRVAREGQRTGSAPAGGVALATTGCAEIVAPRSAQRFAGGEQEAQGLECGFARSRRSVRSERHKRDSNHRPERVEPAFKASLDRLGLKYLDLYLIHTPFAFQSAGEMLPDIAK